MKKLILIFLIICITAFCFFGSASADILTDIDDGTSCVTVSAWLENAANKKVAVEVFKPGKSEADIPSLTPENIAAVYSYVREVSADANGKITFSYRLGSESGKYSVRLKADGADAVMYNDAFNYISPDFEANFIALYCAEDATTAKRLELIETNADILGLNLEDIQTWEEAQRLALIDFAGKDCNSIRGLKAAFECGITAQLIKNGSDASEVSDAFDKYSDSLKACCEIYTLYETYFSASEKGQLYDALSKSSLSSVNSYAEELCSKLFLHSVKNADNYLNVEDILRISEGWLDEDFEDYYKLSGKKNVNIAIMKGSYATPQELCKALHAEVKNANKDNGKPSGTGGSVSPAPTKGSSVNVEVDPTFTAQPPSAPSDSTNNKKIFTDIYTVPWAQEAIYTLRDMNIVHGVSDTLFAPDNNITREEFVKLLVCAFFEVDSSASADFADVSSAHWSFPYIATAAKLGIVNGVSDKSFGIGMHITRQDMASMLFRAAKVGGITLSDVKDASFTDEAYVSDYAYNAVMTMAKAGVINGFEDGSFAPLGKATRAQATKVIYEIVTKEE